jgi:hypothetical protein
MIMKKNACLVKNVAISIMSSLWMIMKGRCYKKLCRVTCLGVSVLVLLGLALQAEALEVSFSSAVYFVAGRGPRAVALVDLNNDHKPDMVVANSYDGSVTVRLGDGSGGFGSVTAYGLLGAEFPMTVVSADLNGDGKADIVTANYISGDVSVLLGNGDGTLQDAVNISTTTFPAETSGPMSVAIDDVNNDGHKDLVVANYEGFTISVLLGGGSGGFGPPINYPIVGPNDVAIADFNKDGKKDLVVLDGSNSAVYVLLGDGSGGFGTPASITVGSHPKSLVVADLNSDSNPDIAVASFDGNKVYVMNSKGDGTFQSAVPYPVGAGPHDIVVRDLNGDGKPDIATADSSGYTVSVLLNNGLGAFGTAAFFPAGNLPLSLAIADLNGDGTPDIVTANFDSDNVAVLLNTTPISLEQKITATLEYFDAAVTSGELGGTGSGNSASGKLGALRNMIEQAGVLIRADNIAGACQQLLDAYNRTDGRPKPSDFVQGSAAGKLAEKILELRSSLNCSTI